MQDADDLVAHQRTYTAFNLLIHWSMVILAALLLWLTLWFATPVGFLGSTITGLVAFVLGYMFLIRGSGH